MKTLVVLTMFMVLLVGCSSTKTVWSQPGADERQFKRDNYECVRDSTTYGGGSGIDGIIAQNRAQDQANRLYRMCMESKGWMREEEASSDRRGSFGLTPLMRSEPDPGLCPAGTRWMGKGCISR